MIERDRKGPLRDRSENHRFTSKRTKKSVSGPLRSLRSPKIKLFNIKNIIIDSFVK